MARTFSGWKFSVVALVGGLCAASPAFAGPTDEPPVGPLIKVELNAAGPGIAVQTTSFQDATGQTDEQFSFADPMLVLGPVLGLNLGYAPSPKLRWGLRGTAGGLAVLAGGDSIPNTSFNAQMRLTVGPTLGVRLAPQSPVELEFGLAFAAQMMAGGQTAIGSPDNGYPLGEAQFGVDALARAIWRPWGARSPVGFNFGVDLGWAMVPHSITSTHGFLAVPDVGIAVGF